MMRSSLIYDSRMHGSDLAIRYLLREPNTWNCNPVRRWDAASTEAMGLPTGLAGDQTIFCALWVPDSDAHKLTSHAELPHIRSNLGTLGFWKSFRASQICRKGRQKTLCLWTATTCAKC
jgi:hypothetical protein